MDLLKYETAFSNDGYSFIGGVDEAGRGPLAGPVVAACAVLPNNFDLLGVNDSKRLTALQREKVYERVISSEVRYGIGIVDASEIDRINILQATYAAMRKAVSALPIVPDILLIDGLPTPELAKCRHFAIVGGDGLSASIAAASIIAKVTRDRLMCEYATTYPEYGFQQHKGYGSAKHLAAIRKFGPCPIHRRSFSPISVFTQSVLL